MVHHKLLGLEDELRRFTPEIREPLYADDKYMNILIGHGRKGSTHYKERIWASIGQVGNGHSIRCVLSLDNGERMTTKIMHKGPPMLSKSIQLPQSPDSPLPSESSEPSNHQQFPTGLQPHDRRSYKRAHLETHESLEGRAGKQPRAYESEIASDDSDVDTPSTVFPISRINSPATHTEPLHGDVDRQLEQRTIRRRIPLATGTVSLTGRLMTELEGRNRAIAAFLDLHAESIDPFRAELEKLSNQYPCLEAPFQRYSEGYEELLRAVVDDVRL